MAFPDVSSRHGHLQREGQSRLAIRQATRKLSTAEIMILTVQGVYCMVLPSVYVNTIGLCPFVHLGDGDEPIATMHT